MRSRPAAGGGRWVDVQPSRLARWVANFGDRHGPVDVAPASPGLLIVAADGATAHLHPPPGASSAPPDLATFLADATRERRIGLLLARRAAVAVGVADGERLIASKVDTSYVQGRTAAGGWSQQRFARRRDNQAKAAASAAADIVARLLVPYAPRLAALVCGGDRATVDQILSDRRLAPVCALRHERLLDVAEPRHAVLVAAVSAARAVPVLVREMQDGGG